MPGMRSILFRVLFVAGNEATILGAGRHPGLHSVTDFAYHSQDQPLAVLAASTFIASLAHFHVLRATAGHDHSVVKFLFHVETNDWSASISAAS